MASSLDFVERGGRSLAQPLLPAIVAALLALAARSLLARGRAAAPTSVPAPCDSVDVPLLASAQFSCETLHRPRPGHRAPFVSLHTVSWQLTDSHAKGVTGACLDTRRRDTHSLSHHFVLPSASIPLTPPPLPHSAAARPQRTQLPRL